VEKRKPQMVIGKDNMYTNIFRNNERLLQIGGFAKALRYIKKEYSPCQASLII